MGQRLRNILVGLMSITGLVCLAMILALFGYVPPALQDGYDVKVVMNDTGGLMPDSHVKLSGIVIGKVRSVSLQPLPRRGVVVKAFIEEGVTVPRQADVSVVGPILGGSPALSFRVDLLDESQLNDVLATDGSAKIEGWAPSLTSQFADELRSALAKPFAQFERLSVQWMQVAENLNNMIEPRTVSHVDSGQVAGNLTTVLARADSNMAQLKTAIDGMNSWLNDEQLKADVVGTAASAHKAARQLEVSVQEVGQFAVDTRENINELARRYMSLADDLSRVIVATQNAVDKAGKGEGSVGKMLNDAALYNNLNDALDRVNTAVKDFQLLIEKWKSEGVPIRL